MPIPAAKAQTWIKKVLATKVLTTKPATKALATLVSGVSLAACVTSTAAVADTAFGELNGVLAAGAPVIFVPVGINDSDCTMYTKKPLRDGILVDTGIWYRTEHDHFVLDADRCVPDRLAPDRAPADGEG